jgi:hypothetical protein
VSTTEWLRSSISAVDPTYDLTKGTFLLAYRLADDADLKKVRTHLLAWRQYAGLLTPFDPEANGSSWILGYQR